LLFFQLQSLNWDTDRKIVTFDGVNSIKPFRFDDLTDLQKTAIDLNMDIETDDHVVNYIRGEVITGFRPRDRKLGDIVHSAPLLVVGDGIDNDSDGEVDETGHGYDKIDNDGDDLVDEEDEQALDEHDGLVFAGSNDGMLHAFNAQTGKEIFAYVPHLVYPNLKMLTEPNYDHQFYVDATPYSRSIEIQNTPKTLLIGGLNKGGKGYYCLDITNILYVDDDNFLESDLATPADLDGIDVRWEYPGQATVTDETFATDDDLGYSFSDIFIVKSYKDDIGSPLGTHNHVAIFGNGYESVTGTAILFILNAYTGEVIKKIDTGVGASNNGLSSPALVDIDNDGIVDYAYAGDLLGNLWKFDLKNPDPDEWIVSYSAPLFTCPSGQAITSAPDVMNHCSINGAYTVNFGTGKFLGETDRTDNSLQTIYGIVDFGEALGTRSFGTNVLAGGISNTSLLEQTEIDFQYLYSTYFRTLSDNEAFWNPGADPLTDGEDNDGDGDIDEADEDVYTHVGWYFDLPMDLDEDSILDGERVIKNVMIRDGKLIAISFTPGDSPCTGGGTSMVHEMNACDGSRLDEPQFDVNGDGIINEQDKIYIDTDGDGVPDTWLAPTGKFFDGLLHPPVIVTMQDKQREMKIFSSSAGTTERIFERAEGGFYFWQEQKD